MVLKTADLKENDKLVWLFTEKLGKVSAVARGAKKSKSKFLSLSLNFSYGEYVLFKGRNLYTINEGELIDSFQVFLKDLDTLTYASYLCELIDIALMDEESNRELFRDFLTAFYLIKSEALDIELIVRAFEVKLLKATGYELNLEHCCLCKKKINKSNYINLQYIGGVCDECSKINGYNISFSAYNALRVLTKLPIEKVYRLGLSDEIKSELNNILSLIISQNYSRKPKSLELFNFIKGVEKND